MRRLCLAVPVIVLIVTGCGTERKQEELQRSPVSIDSATGAVRYYEGSRDIVDSARVDFEGTGKQHIIIASRLLDGGEGSLSGSRFDLIEIFAVDTAGRPSSVFVDPVDNGASFRTEDLNRDGRLELLVSLNAGGNDPITSLGLMVYGLTDDGSFAPMFMSPTGAPEIRDLDGDGKKEILLSDVLYGMMAHSDAVGYTDGVYAFDGTAWTLANEKFTNYYQQQVTARRDAYMRLKRGSVRAADFATEIHSRLMDWLAWAYASGGIQQTRAAWNAERRFLEDVLAPEQIEELEAFVAELELMIQQQKQDPAI